MSPARRLTHPGAPRRWAVPAPDGLPFHRLARTPLHRWWRPLVGTLFILAVGLGATMGVLGVTMTAAVLLDADLPASDNGDGIVGEPTGDLAVQLALIAVWTPVVLLAVWLIQRRPAGGVTSVTGRLRGRWLFACGGLAAGSMMFGLITSDIVYAGTATTTTTATSDGAGWVGWDAFLPPALMILLLVPLQATAEEFLFRGWLLQAIGAFTRSPWPAIVGSAALFTLAHAHQGWALADTFMFGIVAGWLAVRTGGLEAPIAFHVLNNLVALLLSTAAGRLDDPLRVTDQPWQGFVNMAVQLAVFAGMAVVLGRRWRLRTLSGVASPDPG